MFQSFTPQKIVVLIVLGLIVLGGLGCIVTGACFSITNKPEAGADLEIWGVFDDNRSLEGFLPENTGPGGLLAGDVMYREIPFEEFEREVLNAVAAGRGPDIIYLHNTWLAKFKDKLSPMPPGLWGITEEEYRNVYVDVVANDFTSIEEGQWNVWALPLYVDTLGLYWNRDLFNTKGITQPPQTWKEFLDDAAELTELNPDGSIRISGAAMGTARNVNRAADIMSMLMLQTGTKMVSDDRTKATFSRNVTSEGNTFSPGEEALRFYAQFADPTTTAYSWDRAPLVPYSVDAFVDGKLAMMFNYSHTVSLIRERAPQLNFAVASVPQPQALRDQGIAVTYPNYFGLAVLKSSQKQKAAWSLVASLALFDKARIYLDNTGRPPAHRELISEYVSNPDFAPFARQALTAVSWYQPDYFAVEEIFTNMIESVKDGTSPGTAVQRAEENVTTLLRQLNPKGSTL